MIYDIRTDSYTGYSIVLQQEDGFTVPEIFLDAENPYKEVTDKSCMKIYVNTLSYLYFNGDEYVIPGTQISLNNDAIEKLYGGAILSSGSTSFITESISYTYRSENKTEIVKRHPAYYADTTMQNACAPVAGSNVIAYFDRYYEDLISDYATGSTIGNMYLYKEQNDTIETLIRKMNIFMKNDGTGVTLNQFKAGMGEYVTLKDLSITYESCLENNRINLLNLRQYVGKGKPIVLFLSGYNFAVINSADNIDSIHYKVEELSHIMVCFGIKEINYKLTDGSTKNSVYLQVATG